MSTRTRARGRTGTAAGQRPRGVARLPRYGPWAVVTGATSGIGRAVAGELATAGLALVLVARDAAALAAVRDELRGAADIELVPVDLSTAEGVTALVAATAERDVGLLVSAAGFGTSGPCVDGDPATESAMLDLNCRATYLLGREFGARFARRGRGGLVLFGSIVGYQGTPGAAHYAATKAYVQTLGEGLHHELAPAGVDVLVSSPGPVHTGFAARAGLTTTRAAEPGTVAAATLAALGRRTTVTPGGLSKLLRWSLATLPRTARTKVMARVMAAMVAGDGGAAAP
ncbi:SDR family NAD(P)-dependent oxidoreductase [Trujillonella humicola]|uniref:SDR family NAD(P)-dependent oxidoreductase n=1 Tax=Trujillonella humicola TaxID=3383699 RepID=UPI0039063318